MKISRTLNREILHNKEFPMNTIILHLNNGIELYCSDFNHSRKQELEIYAYIVSERKWVKTHGKNEYTEIMWNYHRKIQRKSKCKIDCEQLMRHDRVHKHGSGGSRLGCNGIVTDYECAREPMHDFRRAMYVQWN